MSNILVTGSASGLGAAIVKALDDIAKEKEAELEAQKKVREYIASQCRAGKLKNVDDCAKVGAPIK